MHFLTEYGLFLAKATTVVIAILIILAFIGSLVSRGKGPKDKIKIKKLNKHYEELKHCLNKEILTKTELKRLGKEEKKNLKIQKKQPQHRSRLFLLTFVGDIKASATSSLREEVTAILTVANPQDEVVVCVESPGGMVPGYGLAASQLQRLRANNIPLTVIVDKVAASGGYLMACVGHKILAAPYAIIGSIGVVAQLPNFHRLLQQHAIDFEQITAGEYKRTLSMFGENTDKGREKVQEDVNAIHAMFKQFILKNRPHVDLEKIATGEHWHAVEALSLNLIDELMTSDDYLMRASKQKDIYHLHYLQKKTWLSKCSLSASKALEQLLFYRNRKFDVLL